MSYKIALAMIVGDINSDEAKENWERVIDSFQPYVDGVFVNYNGAENKPPSIPSGIDHFVINHYEWEDDFAKARNQSFEMVPKDEYDWIIWADLDDSLENGDKLQEMLSEIDTETQGVFLPYNYGVDEDGNVLVEQWRERLFRTDCNWRWDYPIHEVCKSPPGTQYAKRDDVQLRHWRKEGVNDRQTRDRNRRILMKARREHPEEPRHDFYFANEVYAEAATKTKIQAYDLYNAAIVSYIDFIEKNPVNDDTYAASHRVAQCYRAIGDYASALDYAVQCLKVFPTWPDAYVEMAQIYAEIGELEDAKFWANFVLDYTAKPTTTQAIDSMSIDCYPHIILGIVYEHEGNYEEAIRHYEVALDAQKDEETLQRLEAVREKLQKENEEPIETSTDFKALRKELRGTRPEKSIAFINRPLFEPWHPKYQEQGGAGGAETCVMELSKRFAADGWRVVVFGTPGEYKGVDEHGVEWWDSDEYLPTEKFTVSIASRAPEVYDSKPNSDVSLLWLHDVNVLDAMDGEWGSRLKNVDKVIGLTNWHTNHLSRLYKIPQEQLSIVPNGVDLSRFADQDIEREPGKFVFSSSPDRGIEVVLGMWQDIKYRIPEAELHVFYGFEAINNIIRTNPDANNSQHLERFKHFVEFSVEQINENVGGVYWHDRIPQDKLAKQLLSADMWLYPTYFLETFCITAIEMQAAGVIPLTSNAGALQETVGNDELRIKGFPNSPMFQNNYVDSLVDTYNLTGKDALRHEGREFASGFTWDNAYDRWLSVIKEASVELVAA